MLVLLYLVIKNSLPIFGANLKALVEPIMVIVITLAGITMLFGAVGMKISNNLGSTIIGGIFRAIGYICQTIVRAIGWIVRSIFRLIPRVFSESRRTFSEQLGMNNWLGNILAILTVIIVLAIII